MEMNNISDISLVKNKDEFSSDDIVTIDVKFSIQGELREAFNEKNWTKAYNKNDNLFKLKYGVKLHTIGIRKHELGKPIDTYRKASIFLDSESKAGKSHEEKKGFGFKSQKILSHLSDFQKKK